MMNAAQRLLLFSMAANFSQDSLPNRLAAAVDPVPGLANVNYVFIVLLAAAVGLFFKLFSSQRRSIK